VGLQELGAFMKRLGLQPTRDTVWRIVKLIPDVDLTETKLLRVSPLPPRLALAI
jgi:hypothetical protein